MSVPNTVLFCANHLISSFFRQVVFKTIAYALITGLSVTTLHAQTVIFTNPGTTYTNSDMVTNNTYNIPVNSCTSISFTLDYSFSQAWEGSGNMESSDECPFGAGCAGDPNNGASTGACANCWDFLYVQYQINGVTVFSELIGEAGTTNAEQSGTISFGPICTNGSGTASIIVQTQTWAANESVTFSNLQVLCWNSTATLSATPNPVCESEVLNLGATLADPSSVLSYEWMGPGVIADPTALNTTATGFPLGTNTYTFTATDENSCTRSSTVNVTVVTGPSMTAPANVSVCAGAPVNVSFSGAPPGTTFSWTNDNPAIGLAASGSGNIAFTSAGVAGVETGTITVTPTLGGCDGPPQTFTITVNPGPTVDDPANQSVCAGDAVNVVFTGSSGTATYNWTNSNTAIGLGASGSGDLNFTAAGVGSPQTGTITVTPTENGCTGAAQTFTITVSPTPNVNQPADQSVCAGQGGAVTFTGTPGATFSWTNDNPAIGLAGSGSGNISFTSASVGLQEIATITVTPQFGVCPGTPRTFTITVNPAPTVDDPANESVCAGDAVNVIFTGNSGTATYNWTNSNTAIGLGSSGSGDLSFTAAGVGSPQTGTITVTPTENGCTGAAQTFTITVSPAPNVNQPADQSVCAGQGVTVTFTGTPGATFNWTNDNPAIGLAGSGAGNISFTSASVGIQEVANITVTPVIGGCVGTPQTFTITVNPTPTVDDPANQTVCGGETVTVNFTGTGNPTYNWTNNNTTIGLGATGSGDINFTAANVAVAQTATITVTPTVNGCPGAAQTFTITVTPAPSVNQPANQSACAGQGVTVNFTGTPGATFNWTNDNPAIGLAGSGSGNISFTGASVGMQEVANITVTPVIGGCIGTPRTFTITINPVPTVNDPFDATVCAGTPVTISFTGTGGPVFNWTNSNPAIGLGASGTGNINFTSAGVTAPETGTLTVTPTVGGCSGVAQTFTITVNPTPTLTQPVDQTACAGETVTVNFNATPGSTLNWTNSNPAIGLSASGAGNISFTAANVATAETGVVTVTPVIGSCSGTPRTFSITVNPSPTVNQPTDVTVCGGQPVSVNFTGTGAPFNWTNSNPAIGLGASGTGDINFTSSMVGGTTVGVITVTPTSGLCPGVPRTFNITVESEPVVTAPADQTTCAGNNITVNFSGTAGAVFTWTNSNPAIGLPASGSGNLNFTAASTATPVSGTITITPQLAGCVGTAVSFVITVNPTPTVNAQAPLVACPNDVVQVLLGGNLPGTVFNWTNSNPAIGLPASGSGDINFSAAVLATQEIGTITVTPALNGCTGAAETFTITVNPEPTAVNPGDQSVCSGDNLSVNLTGSPSPLLSWTNNNPAIGLGASGTGNINFTAAVVSATETGQIIVIPTENGCTGPAVSFNISVVTAPLVNDPSDTSVCANLPVNIVFSGSPGATYAWVNSNPAIGLPASGVGDLSFTAANVTVAETATITITPQLGACTGAPQTFTLTVNPGPTVVGQPSLQACPNNVITVNFSGSPAGLTFDWTNSNPAIGLPGTGSGDISFTAAVVPASTTGTIVVTPVFGGCNGPTETFDITINPQPVLTNPGNQSVCAGQAVAVNFSGTPAGFTVNWVNNNPAIGLPASGTGDIAFTSVGPGGQLAQITATPSANGCTGPVQVFDINIVNNPVVNPVVDLTVCAGQTVNVPLTGTAGSTFAWTNTNPAVGLAVSGTGDIMFTAANVSSQQTAQISVIPQLGACSGTAVTFNIIVSPLPTVTPRADAVFCVGDVVNIPLTGSAGASLDWVNDNTALGLAASGNGNISFTASAAGAAQVIVTPNAGGCAGIPDTFMLNVVSQPAVSPIADVNDCAGAAINVVFSGAPGTTFTWTNSNTAIGLGASGSGPGISFTAANVGAVQSSLLIVTPTAGSCTGTPDSFVITINPLPDVNAQTDLQVCANNTVNVTFNGSLSGTVYNWTNSNPLIGLGASGTGNISFTAASLPLAQTGIITVTPTANGCSGAAQTFQITVDAIPTIVNPGNQTVCSGQNVSIPLSGSPANVSLSWTNSNPTIGLGASGTGNISFAAASVIAPVTAQITVTPSANGCTGLSSSFDITVNPGPSLDNPGNIVACAGAPIAINFNSNDPGATINWTNTNQLVGLATTGAGNIAFSAANVTVPQTAQIIAQAQTGVCTGASAAFTITVSPFPVPTISGDLSVCNNNNTTTLTAAADDAASFSWTGGPSVSTITVSPATTTTYTVTVTNTGACTGTASATVSVFNASAVTIQGTSCNIADTGTVVLVIPNAFGCDSVITRITTYIPADTTLVNAFTCVQSQVGTTVQILDDVSSGCDSVVITTLVYDPAQCPVSGAIIATDASCSDASDGSVLVLINAGSPPFQYNWTDGAGNNGTGQITGLNISTPVIGLAPGNFSLTITPATGQTAVLTAVVQSPPPLVLTVQAVLNNGFAVSCFGETDGAATAIANGGTPPYGYVWNSSDTGPAVNNLGAGQYTVTATDNNGCSVVGNVELTEPSEITIAVDVDLPGCGDLTGPVTITPDGGAEPYIVTVDGVELPGLDTELGAGEHQIEVSDANGCQADSMINVVLPPQADIFLPADTTIQLGTELVLEAITSLVSFDTVIWSPLPDTSCLNCLIQSWTPFQSTVYTVTIVDTFGCTAQARITVQVRRDDDLYVPNIFVPGRGGQNELFKIGAGPSIKSLEEVRIFDRWGDQVYFWDTPIGPNEWPGWDGTARNNPLNPGVFVYYMWVRKVDGERILVRGDVTILR